MERTISLTREQLYQEVWSDAMLRVAARYGLSGNGLAKKCRKHRIPVPGRGYWARLAHGKKVSRPALPVEENRARMIDLPRPLEPTPLPTELEERLVFESDPRNRIVVPERLRSSEPLIRATSAALRAGQPGNGSLSAGKGNLSITVSKAQVARALRIMEAFVAGCRSRGYEIQSSGEARSITFTVHGEPTSVRLEEKIQRREHVLTPSEEKLRTRGHGWGLPRYDYTPTGRLSFEVLEFADGLRRRWSDGKRRKLEDLLNEIMAGMATISITVLRPRRLEHERWERERARQARKQAREEKYLRHLKGTREAWSRNEDFRAFLASVKRRAEDAWGAIPESSAFAKWFAWAESLAERSDPLTAFITTEPGRLRFQEYSYYSPSAWEWEDDADTDET